MMRALWVAVVLLATAGASPPPALPLPPIPPAHPPTDQSAPIPDREAQAPPEDGAQGPRVGVRDFRSYRFTNQGFGYAPGSQFETSEEKRPVQTPGLTVQVPLR
jgi:hypothetical protein